MIILLLLSFPLVIIPTTTIADKELVEIRLEFRNFEPIIKENMITYFIEVEVLTNLTPLKIGISTNQSLITVSPNLYQTTINDINSIFIQTVDGISVTRFDNLSPWNKGQGFVFHMKKNHVGISTSIFILKLSVTFEDLSLFSSTDTLVIAADNFLMVPLVGRYFAREVGFIYSPRIITDNGPSWKNPSNPLYHQIAPQSNGYYYLRFYLSSMILYCCLIIRARNYSKTLFNGKIISNQLYPRH